MTTIRFSDLTEQKKEEIINVLKEESKAIYDKYLQYDIKRHKKIFGWYYRNSANKYFNEWHDFEEYIENLQIDQRKVIAYGIW